MAASTPPFEKGWTYQQNKKGVVEVHNVRERYGLWEGDILNKDGSTRQKVLFAESEYFETESAACNALAHDYAKRIDKAKIQIKNWDDIYKKLLTQRDKARSK